MPGMTNTTESNEYRPLTIGLLHPGEMGGAVGAAAKSGRSRVIWASEGRSPSTRQRAVAFGLEDVGTLDNLVAASDFILSICPPDAAVDLARGVAARRFGGVYIDANAISPATAHAIARSIEDAGGQFVDAGIIGPAPAKPGTTRLYLAGQSAARVASIFDGSLVEAIAMQAGAGAASALKMAHAAWTKGSAALLIAVRALAVAQGVERDLMEEWRRSMPELVSRSEITAPGNARKAWRFVGEMEEIAATFRDAGLPDGFLRASGSIYEKLRGYKDAPAAPSFAEIASAILDAAALQGVKDGLTNAR
jgi:3-hydroxyisobutyrate dehydrogenase-like beta-hydroxyacid dehydrogenase